jgi:ribosomal protein L29
MTKLGFNTADDEVTKLIDKLYEELMMLRYQKMTMKGKKSVDDMAALETKIEEMNENFESIVKSHTLYLKFKKATGQSNVNHSEEMLKQIKEIESNMGKIVSTVPRQ